MSAGGKSAFSIPINSAKYLVLSELVAAVVITLCRTEITRFHAAEVDYQSLQHDAWIHHPELQGVIPRFCQ
jgi:hypothetical protein